MTVVGSEERTMPIVTWVSHKLPFIYPRDNRCSEGLSRREKQSSAPTHGGVHDLQQCERLCPFGEFAHATVDILEADERNEEENAG